MTKLRNMKSSPRKRKFQHVFLKFSPLDNIFMHFLEKTVCESAPPGIFERRQFPTQFVATDSFSRQSNDSVAKKKTDLEVVFSEISLGACSRAPSFQEKHVVLLLFGFCRIEPQSRRAEKKGRGKQETPAFWEVQALDAQLKEQKQWRDDLSSTSLLAHIFSSFWNDDISFNPLVISVQHYS